MAAGENCLPLELNQKEDNELLENATPGSIKKATKYDMKIFQGNNLKNLFWEFKHVLVKAKQCKLMRRLILHISLLFVHCPSGFYLQSKAGKICLNYLFHSHLLDMRWL